MNKKPNEAQHWYNKRSGAAIIAVAAAISAYVLGSRAIDTGSLWQYALTFSLIVIFVRELGNVLLRSQIRKKHE